MSSSLPNVPLASTNVQTRYLTAYRELSGTPLIDLHIMETRPFSSGDNPWSSYISNVYLGRRGPQPLGTVVFEEIEAKAREKLKDYGGTFAAI